MASVALNLHQELKEEQKQLQWDVVLTSLTALGLIIGISLQLSNALPLHILLSYSLAYLAGGLPASWSALKELRYGRLDIDLLMVLAALAAAAVGEARDGAILLFLFSLAATLEAYAMGNTKRAVAALMQLRPDEASLLLDNGQTRRVAVEDLAVGHRVIVKPGETAGKRGV